MSLKRFYVLTASCLALWPACAWAEYSPTDPGAIQSKQELTLAERMALARQFVAKVSDGFKKADRHMGMAVEEQGSILPEGEELLFRLRLKDKVNAQKPYITLESLVLGRSENKKILLSLRDFVTALDFPIKYDEETKKAEGWYIRENTIFVLDGPSRAVKSGASEFKLSDAVKVEKEDVFVPAEELALWFNLGMKPEVNFLSIGLESERPLPIQEAMLRRGREKYDYDVGPAILPTKELERQAIDFPVVDVSTSTNHERPGEEGRKPTTRQTASVRTSGDFAYGTLTTQSQLDREDKVRSVRATYSRESLEPELLGPLNARRYELGDVNSVNLPLQQNGRSGIGARVTNSDPLRSYIQPSTEVTGTYFPDWDVELYRENQLLDFQTIGDDGMYRFENVSLQGSGNNFRLVFYGPQGEIKEEEFVVPVNLDRLADEGSAYDISIARQNSHAYDKLKGRGEDDGSPLLTASYEMPVGESTVAMAGIEAGKTAGENKASLHGGIATTMLDTLFNLDASMDNNSEMAGQIVARRDLGRHQLRNELRLNTEGYHAQDSGIGTGGLFGTQKTSESPQEVLKNQFSLYGPFPIELGKNTRYNLGLTYSEKSNSESDIYSNAGLFTSWDNISAGQSLVYNMPSGNAEDRLSTETTLSGTWGKNRVRLVSDYEVLPESRLASVVAGIQHRYNKNINLDFNVQREMEPALTTATARVNWDAGFANISPSISYNTDKDVTATLNTRFGLVRDPQERIYKSYERQASGSGGLSAFVFLDKDGNNQFDADDEPIQGAVVRAPQNGGRETTNEKGYALFRNMARMKLTDVFVDDSTLPDPFWISGYGGASIVPREGYVAQMAFPVHISGEIDGTVYGRGEGDTAYPMRGMSVSLYKPSGEKLMTSSSEYDGFYLFSKIPPGTYYLAMDEQDSVKNYARPLPQKINIGYEGTTLYANNIYMNGGKDVPVNILSKGDINEEDSLKFAGKSYALNLGSYKSQLMMGLIWFKAKSFYSSIIGADLVDKPSQSYPDKKTGKYSLRIALNASSLQEAYRQCQIIADKGQDCSVDVLPGALEGKPYEPPAQMQANAEASGQ